jgi:hypothetical protein
VRTKLLLATVTAVLGFVAAWLIGRQPAPKPDGADTVANPLPTEPLANAPVMPPPRKLDPEWLVPTVPTGKKLPLSEIYASVNQEELESAPFGRDEETVFEWRELRAVLVKHGRPTAFVVRAQTIYGAISETLDAFETRRSMTRLAPAKRDESNQLWAFVFIGNGSNSPYWNIDSVLINGSEFTLRYVPTLRTAAYGRSFPHAYWIPLGKEHSGTITLRVVDGEDGCEVLKTCTRLERE